MKKWIALLLALVMCLALCACSSDSEDDEEEAGQRYFAVIPENGRVGYQVTLLDGKITFEHDNGWGSGYGYEGINTPLETLATGTYKLEDNEMTITWDEDSIGYYFLDTYRNFTYDPYDDSFSFEYVDEGLGIEEEWELGRVSKSDNQNHKKSDVIQAAEDVVMSDKISASPSVTEFCPNSECVVICYGGNTWAVKGYVDTESEYGQTVRYDWFVRLTYSNNSDDVFTRVWLAE